MKGKMKGEKKEKKILEDREQNGKNGTACGKHQRTCRNWRKKELHCK
jgi:hypothetical protein